MVWIYSTRSFRATESIASEKCADEARRPKGLLADQSDAFLCCDRILSAMKVPKVLALALIGTVAVTGLVTIARGEEVDGEETPELLGPLTRQEIEAAVPDWIEQEINSTPDLELAADLISALRDAEITVFMGTWCSDSKRELSRLWRAFDDLGIGEANAVSYIGVDRSKEEPRELVDGVDLQYVPTFIVRRDGKELGRVVEESPVSIEADLLAILEAEKSGLVTAKPELLEDR